MIVGFTRYSRDQSFAVIKSNRIFLLVMAFGSILGAFIGDSSSASSRVSCCCLLLL